MKRILLMILVGLLLVSCGGNRSLDESKIKRLVEQCVEIRNADAARISQRYVIEKIDQPLLENETTASVFVLATQEHLDINGEVGNSYRDEMVFVFRKNMDGEWVFARAQFFLANGKCDSLEYK